jgi:hypothetical protein
MLGTASGSSISSLKAATRATKRTRVSGV